MAWLEHLKSTKDELDKTSPSFCLAKWLQVTIHLQNGFNHSCHHPQVHKISLDELAKDPTALHNTEYKKALRKMMLEGARPGECNYCWKVEDTPGDHYSDRIIKSADFWARPFVNKVAEQSPEKNINPTYVEVSFGSDCNFRCSYCLPHVSSSIWNQYQKYGPYVGRSSIQDTIDAGLQPYAPGEANPYVDAFWKWFPDLSKDLRVFRITGGEPLLNPNTFRVLEFIEANPLPEMELCINTNMGIPDKFYLPFLEKSEKLIRDKKLKNFMVYTSVDTHGSQAEYIRTGMNYDRWLKNVRVFLERVPANLTFMVTFNAFSPPRFIHLLKDLIELNKEFLNPNGTHQYDHKRTMLDITHLTNPTYLSPWILTPKWRSKIAEIAQFMESHSHSDTCKFGFTDYELHKMKRISAWVDGIPHDSIEAKQNRGNFFIFLKQYETREGKRFLDIFPEMEDFYLEAKQCANSEFRPAEFEF